jgi:integrase
MDTDVTSTTEPKETKKRRPKGDGSVQQIGTNKFKIQLDLDRDANGKRQRKSFTGRTQGEVVKKLNAWKADQLKGTLVANSSIRFSEYVKRWLEIKKGQTKRSTYESYVDVCESHITPVLGPHKVQKVTTANLNDYIQTKLKAGLSTATVTRQRAIIHNILDLAIKEGIVGRNVSDNCTTLTIQREQTKTLSLEEITKLLEVAKGIYEADKGKGNKFFQIYHIVLLALATGARRGEILALKWENIDFDKNVITIRDSLTEAEGGVYIDTPKTNASRRVIAVDLAVLKELQELKKVNDELTKKIVDKESPWVFSTRDCKPLTPSNMSRAWRSLLADAELKDIRFHDLRHTQATHLIANGTNIKTVSARMGHATTRITLDLYAHALPEQDREAAERMGSWLIKQVTTE